MKKTEIDIKWWFTLDQDSSWVMQVSSYWCEKRKKYIYLFQELWIRRTWYQFSLWSKLQITLAYVYTAFFGIKKKKKRRLRLDIQWKLQYCTLPSFYIITDYQMEKAISCVALIYLDRISKLFWNEIKKWNLTWSLAWEILVSLIHLSPL